ncbi:c-type cytochrome [Helicobacter mustelae]|uniref:Putative cytochrome C n=1 Tax=Helicobacter mustelae (strain ATCC 43772 / CCUG 25715 / CIP 103759 / LMG 18044 / NCTC 12198 / R85-136P) TaxID=679897 RepID=D3UFY4_HELM1|nr:c-type cytochrome [Helicobacter mustelae]CBG39405.1 putative cytochrome C [Helicobacter mustelae 12198]SQH70918.1 cytochrome C [Helicobacter mustelae]STP12045.1 cytochrome C [Helicobacter mustelae]
MKKALVILSLGVVALYANPAKIVKTKCAVCHGQKMEKAALGKSAIVNTLSAKQIEEDLRGYKAKTLNRHGLGGTMWGQAASLSDEDIKGLAKYISTDLKDKK